MGPFYTVMEGSEGGLRWLSAMYDCVCRRMADEVLMEVAGCLM